MVSKSSPKGAVFTNTGQRPVKESTNHKSALKGQRNLNNTACCLWCQNLAPKGRSSSTQGSALCKKARIKNKPWKGAGLPESNSWQNRINRYRLHLFVALRAPRPRGPSWWGTISICIYHPRCTVPEGTHLLLARKPVIWANPSKKNASLINKTEQQQFYTNGRYHD